jgi:hypothetical protein
MKRGVYGAALIKKRRYWSAGVPGAAIDEYFAPKEVGDVDALQHQELLQTNTSVS